MCSIRSAWITWRITDKNKEPEQLNRGIIISPCAVDGEQEWI